MRAVVFDFGAVLFRWQPVEFLQVLVPDLAPDEAASRRLAAAMFESFAPTSDWAQFDLGRVDPDTLAVRIGARTGHPVPRLRFVIDAIADELQPLADSVALCRRLAASHRMYYLSNMPVPYAQALTARHAFVREFADGIYSSDVNLIKPQPEIFALAERRFSLVPGETVFLDDNPHNVKAARARGWLAIEYTDASAAADELLRLGWIAPPHEG